MAADVQSVEVNMVSDEGMISDEEGDSEEDEDEGDSEEDEEEGKKIK